MKREIKQNDICGRTDNCTDCSETLWSHCLAVGFSAGSTLDFVDSRRYFELFSSKKTMKNETRVLTAQNV